MIVIVSDLGVIAESYVCVRARACPSIYLLVRKQLYVVYNLNMNAECDYIGNS